MVPSPAMMEKVTSLFLTGVVKLSVVTFANILMYDTVGGGPMRLSLSLAGVWVKDMILLPVPTVGRRVMIAAPAEFPVAPVTVAETASWMLKLGELFPAVYVAVAVPLASVVPFTTVKAGAPLLFVTNAKVTASPGAGVESGL
jgi:hypothetical protein